MTPAVSAENELVEKCLDVDLSEPAALTCAHRYALFTLGGIAGEDDLDAPDLGSNPRADPKAGQVAQVAALVSWRRPCYSYQCIPSRPCRREYLAGRSPN